ncbi:PaaI family thioesterase [Phenylobacterium sp.]|uniref:PaaI family thioesterase n=1 Tax=Phenylobacterium sp. TaxID=1871053 RepID=UPI0025DB1656|nr:PaaI family thioesterase [Phenylobacterium sp.]
MAEDRIPPPPEGFVLTQGRGPFSTHNGPYYHRVSDGDLVEQAFYALPRHANGIGIVHGGMLSAFTDGLLAAAVGRGARQVAVTIHLSIDFLHMARQGDWVVGEARMSRATKDVAFADGRLHARGVDIVRASGVFKLMTRHG